MRLTSSNQRLGAGTDRGVQGNAIPENPAPDSPLPPNESSMKYRYKDYDSNLSEIIALPKITGPALVLAFSSWNDFDLVFAFLLNRSGQELSHPAISPISPMKIMFGLGLRSYSSLIMLDS
jgi:hypothetical protein